MRAASRNKPVLSLIPAGRNDAISGMLLGTARWEVGNGTLRPIGEFADDSLDDIYAILNLDRSRPVPSRAQFDAMHAERLARQSVSDAPAKRKAAKRRKTVVGGQIPEYVTGVARITGTLAASTGEAVIVEIKGEEVIAREIVVWAGPVQDMLRGRIKAKGPVTLRVRQPANDRFKPSATWGKAA